ncbi:hypothetical protein AK95_17340 [Paenibacillus sp. LC231]|nr:hypothetical protein AK95_17340 [Paenibacillus sp. LC231]
MSRKQFHYTSARNRYLDFIMRYSDLRLIPLQGILESLWEACHYPDFTMWYPDFMINARAFTPAFFAISIYNVFTTIKTLSHGGGLKGTTASVWLKH